VRWSRIRWSPEAVRTPGLFEGSGSADRVIRESSAISAEEAAATVAEAPGGDPFLIVPDAGSARLHALRAADAEHRLREVG
jgi:hypothetical protein